MGIGPSATPSVTSEEKLQIFKRWRQHNQLCLSSLLQNKEEATFEFLALPQDVEIIILVELGFNMASQLSRVCKNWSLVSNFLVQGICFQLCPGLSPAVGQKKSKTPQSWAGVLDGFLHDVCLFNKAPKKKIEAFKIFDKIPATPPACLSDTIRLLHSFSPNLLNRAATRDLLEELDEKHAAQGEHCASFEFLKLCICEPPSPWNKKKTLNNIISRYIPRQIDFCQAMLSCGHPVFLPENFEQLVTYCETEQDNLMVCAHKLGPFRANFKPAVTLLIQNLVSLFDLSQMSLCDIICSFCFLYPLPPEAQLIDVIFEQLSGVYYDACEAAHNEGSPTSMDAIQLWDKPDVKRSDSVDSIFIIMFSAIMLSTDRHSPQVKQKMTKENFIKANQGTCCGGNFPDEFLAELYNEIGYNPIYYDDKK